MKDICCKLSCTSLTPFSKTQKVDPLPNSNTLYPFCPGLFTSSCNDLWGYSLGTERQKEQVCMFHIPFRRATVPSVL